MEGHIEKTMVMVMVKGSACLPIQNKILHCTLFIYGYMASDIWLRTILIVIKETRCRRIGYSFRLTASVLLYAPSHRQDSTHHSLCYTSRGALAGTRNSSITPNHNHLPAIPRQIYPGDGGSHRKDHGHGHG